MNEPAPENLLAAAGSLWMDAGSVIALRTARIGLGDPSAGDEMIRMVTEKVWAAWEVGFAMATGGLGQDPEAICRGALSHYRRAVQDNLQRLRPAS